MHGRNYHWLQSDYDILNNKHIKQIVNGKEIPINVLKHELHLTFTQVSNKLQQKMERVEGRAAGRLQHMEHYWVAPRFKERSTKHWTEVEDMNLMVEANKEGTIDDLCAVTHRTHAANIRRMKTIKDNEEFKDWFKYKVLRF